MVQVRVLAVAPRLTLRDTVSLARRPKEAAMESAADFEERVKARTGLSLGDIPRGEAEELLGGHIFARRGEVVVFAVGYPDGEDEDGCPVWGSSSFRRVDL